MRKLRSWWCSRTTTEQVLIIITLLIMIVVLTATLSLPKELGFVHERVDIDGTDFAPILNGLAFLFYIAMGILFIGGGGIAIGLMWLIYSFARHRKHKKEMTAQLKRGADEVKEKANP